jgi:hypothetical protein
MKKAAFAITLLAVCSNALAESNALTKSQLKLALHLAKVSAHEGAIVNPRDIDLVWQVTQNNGETVDRQIKFLEQHSGRAIGTKEPRDGDANKWSREMTYALTVPASIASANTGYWKAVTIPRFSKLLDRAKYLVAGGSYDKPCHIEPKTWGSVLLDSARAAKDGRFPIGCIGTINDGFTTKQELRKTH